MYILLFGQVLMGLGTTPLYTLGIAYLEDSVSKNKAPIYLGKFSILLLNNNFAPVLFIIVL